MERTGDSGPGSGGGIADHVRVGPRVFVVFLVLAVGAPAAGQETEEQVADELVSDEVPAEEVEDEGLVWKIGPGLGFSFNDNRNVVGQPDGWALTLDAAVPASVGYRAGGHEVRAAFEGQVAFSRSTALSEFIKSKDLFAFDADYLFHAIEVLGPYVHFGLEAAMLPGYDTRAGATVWLVMRRGGGVERWAGTRFRLTDPFLPITFRESAGLFVHPYASDAFAIETRAGFGGLHTLADGQLVVSDDGGTDEIEVRELYSFDQAAVEMGVALFGRYVEDKVSWRVGADVAIPVVSRPEDPGRSLEEMINVDLNATLSFKLLSWLSIDYTFRALRRPQLVDAFQIQNNLLVTLSYTWSSAEGEAE
ncbi:MAG: hypothetical protein HY907_10450 [Deltaproteobacteria bacterium]|nr:hypothetical protein [Deltaproteobacteria bacterium]